MAVVLRARLLAAKTVYDLEPMLFIIKSLKLFTIMSLKLFTIKGSFEWTTRMQPA